MRPLKLKYRQSHQKYFFLHFFLVKNDRNTDDRGLSIIIISFNLMKENWCKNIWLLSFEQKAGGAATLRHQMSDWFQSIHKLNCSDLRVNTHEVFISPHVIIFDCNHVCWKRLLTRCYFDRIPKVARVRERERKRERKRDREKENRFWLKEK